MRYNRPLTPGFPLRNEVGVEFQRKRRDRDDSYRGTFSAPLSSPVTGVELSTAVCRSSAVVRAPPLKPVMAFRRVRAHTDPELVELVSGQHDPQTSDYLQWANE